MSMISTSPTAAQKMMVKSTPDTDYADEDGNKPLLFV